MAGSIKIEFANGEYSILMYGGDDKLVDRFDVSYDKLSLSRDAALALSDEVTALLM